MDRRVKSGDDGRDVLPVPATKIQPLIAAMRAASRALSRDHHGTGDFAFLGIDPGLRRTGWGVIEADGNRLIYVACGSAQTDDTTSLAERLVTLHDALVRVVDEFRPEEAAVEATFRQQGMRPRPSSSARPAASPWWCLQRPA